MYYKTFLINVPFNPSLLLSIACSWETSYKRHCPRNPKSNCLSEAMILAVVNAILAIA